MEVKLNESAEISGTIRGVDDNNIRLIAKSTDSYKNFRKTWGNEEMSIGSEGRFTSTWDTTSYVVGSEFELLLKNGEEVEKKADGLFIEFVPRSVYDKRDFEFNIDNKNSDGIIELHRSSQAEVSGTVSGFKKGDEIMIKISSTDASESFRMGEKVVVDSSEQYNFDVTFDLSDQKVGDEFDISIGDQSVNGRIVECSVFDRCAWTL